MMGLTLKKGKFAQLNDFIPHFASLQDAGIIVFLMDHLIRRMIIILLNFLVFESSLFCDNQHTIQYIKWDAIMICVALGAILIYSPLHGILDEHILHILSLML